MRVLIIDNYDSFTFNLYQDIGETLGRLRGHDFDVRVIRNNELDLAGVRAARPDRIVISPGPGNPSDPAYFGVCAEVISELGPSVPMLGVCLGMQGMVHVFGGRIVPAPLPMHGKVSAIAHNGRGLYRDMPQGVEVMRYHSLMVDPGSLPADFEITAVIAAPGETVAANSESAAAGREIMGVRHRHYPMEGVQYHPESFGTEGGRQLLTNFLLQ